MFEPHDVIFEVYIEDKLINRQRIQAPKQMIIANFVNTAEQIKDDQRPIKLKMIRQEIIWDDFEQKQKVIDNEIELDNLAMTAWQENNKNEKENKDEST